MALLYLKNVLAAQDAVQDVFEKLWSKRQSFESIDNPAGYLYTIGRNYIISELRKKSFTSNAGVDALHSLPESGPSPDRILDIKEISKAIQLAVDALPPQQKKVFKLTRDEGLSLKEVAVRLRISYSTAREYMSLALQSVRKYLAAHLNELPGVIALFFL